MPRVEIPLIGPDYTNRERPLSSQAAKNLWPEVNPEAKNQVCLHNTAGLKTFAVLSGIDRGMHDFNNLLYAVNGQTLYSIDDEGTSLALGTVGGSDRCVMANDSEQLIIATGGTPYRYTASGGLEEITDPDLVNPTWVAYINNQFVFDNNAGVWGEWVSSSIEAGLAIDALDYAQAEAHPDPLVRGVTFRQLVYFYGSHSVEPWQNTGTGNPPFARVNSGVQPIGLAGTHAIVVTNDYMYFLDTKRIPRRSNGLNFQPIGNPAIGVEFAKYSRISDCIAFEFVQDNQQFVAFTFPTADKTWCFHEPSGSWFQLSYIETGAMNTNAYQPINQSVSIAFTSGATCSYEEPSTTCSATGVYTATASRFINTPNSYLWSVESGAATIVGSATGSTVTISTGDAAGTVAFLLKVVATDTTTGTSASSTSSFSHVHSDATTAPIYIGPDISNASYPIGSAITPVDVSGLFTGSGLVFSLAGSWPTGLSIDSGTGIISGTPTDSAAAYAGLYVTATNSLGSDDSATFQITLTGVTTVVYDTFTDADATNIASHTPDTDTVGGGWSATAGVIYGNKVEWTAGSFSVIDSGISDFTLTCDVYFPSGTQYVDVLFRYSGGAYFQLEIGKSPLNVMKLYSQPGATLLATGSTTGLADTTWHTIEVVCSGSSIQASINGGAAEISITNATNQTATSHGIKTFASGSWHDNFKVTT